MCDKTKLVKKINLWLSSTFDKTQCDKCNCYNSNCDKTYIGEEELNVTKLKLLQILNVTKLKLYQK